MNKCKLFALVLMIVTTCLMVGACGEGRSKPISQAPQPAPSQPAPSVSEPPSVTQPETPPVPKVDSSAELKEEWAEAKKDLTPDRQKLIQFSICEAQESYNTITEFKTKVETALSDQSTTEAALGFTTKDVQNALKQATLTYFNSLKDAIGVDREVTDCEASEGEGYFVCKASLILVMKQLMKDESLTSEETKVSADQLKTLAERAVAYDVKNLTQDMLTDVKQVLADFNISYSKVGLTKEKLQKVENGEED